MVTKIVYIVFVYSFSSSSQLSSPCSTRVPLQSDQEEGKSRERKNPEKIKNQLPFFHHFFFFLLSGFHFFSSDPLPFFTKFIFSSWVCVFLIKDSVFNSWKVKKLLIIIWVGFWCGNDVDINIKSVFLKVLWKLVVTWFLQQHHY